MSRGGAEREREGEGDTELEEGSTLSAQRLIGLKPQNHEIMT